MNDPLHAHDKETQMTPHNILNAMNGGQSKPHFDEEKQNVKKRKIGDAIEIERKCIHIVFITSLSATFD